MSLLELDAFKHRLQPESDVFIIFLVERNPVAIHIRMNSDPSAAFVSTIPIFKSPPVVRAHPVDLTKVRTLIPSVEHMKIAGLELRFRE